MPPTNEEVERTSRNHRVHMINAMCYCRDAVMDKLRDDLAFRQEMIKKYEHKVCISLVSRHHHGPVSGAWFTWAVGKTIWDELVLMSPNLPSRRSRSAQGWADRNRQPGHPDDAGVPSSAAWIRFCDAMHENYPLTQAQIDAVFAPGAPSIATEEQTAAFVERLQGPLLDLLNEYDNADEPITTKDQEKAVEGGDEEGRRQEGQAAGVVCEPLGVKSDKDEDKDDWESWDVLESY
ncbi:hypothetical protein B0H63DRAFT_517039 [Podospora didyma]|uniref:Uncharacterized protein n=1 Tax=Podospora didyma TaxID=330526 RepID=A0AAE0U7P9_9PEZI|nr:hypothetical protein B0H63DRAFT_517039 [Podospora didyma]